MKTKQFPKRNIQTLPSDTQIAWHVHLIFCPDCRAGWPHLKGGGAASSQSHERRWWQGGLGSGFLSLPCWRPWHRRSPKPSRALQEPAQCCEQTMQLAGFHNVPLWVTFPGKIIRGRPCLLLVIGFISSEVNFRDVPRKHQKRLRGGCPVNYFWNKKVHRLCPSVCVQGSPQGSLGPWGGWALLLLSQWW